MKKFLKVNIKCDGVVEKDTWTKEYLKPIQDFVDSYNDSSDTVIYDIGLDDSDTLIVIVEFVGSTKKQCDALFTLFKGKLTSMLKSYGLKKLTPILKAYGDKIF